MCFKLFVLHIYMYANGKCIKNHPASVCLCVCSYMCLFFSIFVSIELILVRWFPCTCRLIFPQNTLSLSLHLVTKTTLSSILSIFFHEIVPYLIFLFLVSESFLYGENVAHYRRSRGNSVGGFFLFARRSPWFMSALWQCSSIYSKIDVAKYTMI